MAATATERTVRFGVFEVDLESGELRKAGRRVALQEQPFRVLVQLLRRPGEVVTREELRAELWPADTFVDFEQGLNGAVKRLREALGDSADSPRYIETLARRGYRFLGPVARGAPSVIAAPVSRIRPLVVLTFLFVGAAAGAFLTWRLPGARPAQTVHLTISIAAAGLTLTDGGVAVSPDGSTIAFAARHADEEPQIYVRRLDQWDSHPLKGTTGGVTPFFSPDGLWVAFEAKGMLKKVEIQNGTPQTLCEVGYQGASRGSWDLTGLIVTDQLGLLTVKSGVCTQKKLVAHGFAYWPQMMPDGRTVMFTDAGLRIASVNLKTGKVNSVLNRATCARYLPTGHLTYESEGHLLAARFDPVGLRVLGGARVVIDDIAIGDDPGSAASFAYDVSASGTIVYLPAAVSKRFLVWKDRTGRGQPLKLLPRQYGWPSLSADGHRITVTVARWPKWEVWVGSVDGEPLNRLTAGCCSLLSPDGEWVIFSGGYPEFRLSRMHWEGGGKVGRLVDNSRHPGKPSALSRDGRILLFNEAFNIGPNRDIMQVNVDDPTSLRPFLQTPANELEATLSPDDKWVAYQSDESGEWEIYVRPYSGSGHVRRISIDGGMGPIWNPRGGELFYQTRSAVMAVQIKDGAAIGSPTKLFTAWKSEDYRREFDVTPDGEHFLMVEPASSRTEINVITNWFEELKAKVPKE